ncbi:HD domain-containing protein [Thiolapillus sp.]
MNRLQDIARILDFIVEVEKLKAVLRKTRPVGLGRYENSAEHSWHVCLAALMLQNFANEALDIDRVIRMLLIHDLGEIDAGDQIVYAGHTASRYREERAGVARVLGMLPEEQAAEYLALWEEFEAGETPESRYARAIDRVPPLLHNLHGGGHSWKENGISREQVMALNSRIALGSEALWQVLRERLEQAADDGLLT